MGRLFILRKDLSIVCDFQDAKLFGSFACAALYEDAKYYYATLIPPADSTPAYEMLMRHWQPYLVSVTTSVHGSSRQPSPDTAYKHVLAQFPIVNLPAVQQFYAKHHSKELDELMLNYCRRYIDFDFIDAEPEQKSLFVFAKDINTNEPLPPIEKFPGTEQCPEFLADLKELVTTHLRTPVKLSQLDCIDNQLQATAYSPAFFQHKRETASRMTATPSFQP